jgi:hypothetical protein
MKINRQQIFVKCGIYSKKKRKDELCYILTEQFLFKIRADDDKDLSMSQKIA